MEIELINSIDRQKIIEMYDAEEEEEVCMIFLH